MKRRYKNVEIFPIWGRNNKNNIVENFLRNAVQGQTIIVLFRVLVCSMM